MTPLGTFTLLLLLALSLTGKLFSSVYSIKEKKKLEHVKE